jgi:hypothetical protein
MTATLTATVDATNARVLLTVAGWTAATEAMIRRLSATDNLAVRGAEPVTRDQRRRGAVRLRGAVRRGGHLPGDEPAGQHDVVVTSSPVTLASSGKTWLRHPGRPILNRAVVVQPRRRDPPATGRGVFPVIGRARPIVVSQVRGSEDGTVRLH